MPKERARNITGDPEDATHPARVAKATGRCAWVTGGRQCFLPGGLTTAIGDGARLYCHWHFVCKEHGAQWAEDEKEFRNWLHLWGRYCSLETHYPPADVWDALRGLVPLHGAPQWCGLLVCRHYSIVETEAWLREGRGLALGEWQRPVKLLVPTGPMWRIDQLDAKAIAARKSLGVQAETVIEQPAEVPW